MGLSAASRSVGMRARAVALAIALLGAVLAFALATPGLARAAGLMAWGSNRSGELGNGSSSRSTVPVAVSGLTSGVRAISAGSAHALARLGDGTVRAWGDNEYGQLGIGTSKGPETCSFAPCSKKPLTVSGLSGVGPIAGGAGHTLAPLGDGSGPG